MGTLRNLLTNTRTLFALYAILAVIAALQLYSIPPHKFEMPKTVNAADPVNNADTLKLFEGHTFTDYNNYIVFKNSFNHLQAGTNLYKIYPAEQWDLYKYSPTFAFLMGAFTYLPNIAGLMLWNLINALALFFAIRLLPFKDKIQAFILWIMALELLTSLQNGQSNGLMAALMIAGYGCMQHKKIAWATLWIVLATFIKVYGAIGFCLFLFYPGKLKFAAYSLLWMAIFACLPLFVTAPEFLVMQYQNWAAMMAADQSASYGLSVMGWLHSWFGVNSGKSIVTIAGILLFLAPLLRTKLYKNDVYRLLSLASMLVWVIIFNHKAESPTYIIALAGVAIWFYARPQAAWRVAVLVLVLVFTSLSVTDLFPHTIKDSFLNPYTIKAVPCIIAWCIIFAELMLVKRKEELPAKYAVESSFWKKHSTK